MAKERTIERVDTDISNHSVRLPLVEMANRLMNNLQAMHDHLQDLLMQKLSGEARNVIAVERARQTSEGKIFDNSQEHSGSHLIRFAEEQVNDLELLNEYRRRYADILGELLVAKDRLIELGRGLQERELAQNSSKNLKTETLDSGGMYGKKGRRPRRPLSPSSSASISSEGGSEPEVVIEL